MSLAPKPPPELQFTADEGASEICRRVAKFAAREAAGYGSRRFFEAVAAALGRVNPSDARNSVGQAAGAELAGELARHVREPWARDGIERGLDLFTHCIDETGRRCVASLVAEYFGWRECPDPFFHRAGSIIARRSATELIRLAQVTGGYARTPKPNADERRLLAAVPRQTSVPFPRHPSDALAYTNPFCERVLMVLGFIGDPARERLRSFTEVPSLGSEGVVGALSNAEFAWLVEPGPVAVPVVGRALLWFPRESDHDLRRLHLLLAAAIA